MTKIMRNYINCDLKPMEIDTYKDLNLTSYSLIVDEGPTKPTQYICKRMG